MRILFLLLFATTFLGAQAQEIRGLARSAENLPLAGATLSLHKATDSSVVKLAVTEGDGSYRFSGAAPGAYFVRATFVGYAPASTPGFILGSSGVEAPLLKLSPLPAAMKDVVVTARKPMVEVKPDKMVVNVEGTINATGTDAMELLRKSPGVNVDKDENLSLSGKSGVQVYIDGRPTPLSGQDLAAYLRSMQSANIEAIEIITNPSAKYEAAGNGGIINIRLKKNKSLGANGTVNAGYAVGRLSKYNAGFSLNYRNAKTNLFGNYNYSDGINSQDLSIDRSVADSLFETRNRVRMSYRNHNFKAGMDYFINKQHTVGLMVNGSIADPANANDSRTTVMDAARQVDRILLAANQRTSERDNLNLNLNYSFNGTGGKTLSLNADYGRYNMASDQLQPSRYFDPSGQTELYSVISRMLAPSTIDISSVKADWEQPFAKGRLGFGGKSAIIKTDNDFRRYNVHGTTEVLDKDRSNRFRYHEGIHAAYLTYSRPFKGFTVQAGLRAEHTATRGSSIGERWKGNAYESYDSTFRRSYTDLFPSAGITFNKNPESQWSLNYSRRVDRPGYQDINPFEFKIDEYTYQKGNIDLRPQYTNSFGLTHTYKYKLNTTLNYSHVQNMFVQWIDTVETSRSFLSKVNLASQDIVSLNVTYPFTYKALTVFANVNANFSKYKADFGAGREVNMEAFGLTTYLQNSLRFAKTWTAELTAFYAAPSIYQGSFKARSLWSVDAGVQKSLMENRMTIKAAVSDVFGSLYFRGSTDFAGQSSSIVSRWESQQFRISLSFRFGNNGVKAARQRTTSAEEETKRVNGGGGMGMGQ